MQNWMRYFIFITACTSQERGSSCEAMLGGLAFLHFLFTQKKFHFPPKPMRFFPPLFPFTGFEEIIFQSLFLGWGGCYRFLAEKRDG